MKLTKEQVEKVRELLKNEDLTGADIARRFGVSTSAIYHIKNNKSWKEPDGTEV